MGRLSIMRLVLNLFLLALLLSPVLEQSLCAQAMNSITEPSAAAQAEVPDYEPVTAKERFHWFVSATAGPPSLLFGGPVSAGFGTLRNKPREYGTHWDGFGDRYGMRLTGISTGNAMEAILGSLWGEDPRYFRSRERGFGTRTKYVIKASFLAPRRDGRWHPAYARYIGNVGNNFLSNTWRVSSENGPDNALIRCVWGLVGELGGNAFAEFWPDVKGKIFHRK
jgi:hypothetical protein